MARVETSFLVYAVLIGIDCDLHEVTWWAESGAHHQGKPATSVPALTQFLTDQADSTILFEIAGAVDYTDNKGAAHNKRRWTIYNVAMAQQLDHLFHTGLLFRHEFLVAPSNLWTKGYPEKQRHALCRCTGATHDLREAQAMTRMYLRNPGAWTRLNDYLGQL